MSMISPEEIENWFEGTQLYDGGDVEGALKKFGNVTQNSRILFNAGCCYLTINDIKAAAKSYKSAVENDHHLAVGYFMVGLTSFLLQEYESAMTAFTRSLELLRENRYVDYKQVGLNYQLYSCEILSNQAVMAYHLNQFDKAKEYLLAAVGCKAEPRHKATFEMLIALQIGDEITPYVLPKNRIFRPPRSYVQNLKKKDYLGKAKVITTDDQEDVYACFSGIKDEVIKKNKEKEAKIKNPQIGDTRPRTRAMTRTIMLKELQMPERKKTLKKTIVKKRRPTFKVGKIVDNPQDSNNLSPSKEKISKPKPKSPCPPRRPSATPSEDSASGTARSMSVESKNSADGTKSPQLLKVSDSESEGFFSSSPRSTERKLSFESEGDTTRIVEENSKQLLIDKYNHRLSAPDIMVGHSQILLQHLPKPQKMQPALPEEVSSLLQKKRFSTTDIESEKERRMSLTLMKPFKKPPALLEADEEDEENNFASLSSVEDSGIDRQSPDGQITTNSSTQVPDKTKDSHKKKVKKERKVEVEIQYTFVTKLRVPVGCDLERLHEIAKTARVPDQIELCYQDKLGRQRTLSDEDLESLLFRTSKPQNLLCYPNI